jgi:hypothetical protein
MNIDNLNYQNPILICNLPVLIFQEINSWVEESKKIKNHPLAELKAHENVAYLSEDGKKHNSYQCSISSYLIESSFWLAYTLRVCALYWGGHHRDYFIRKWDGHFDGYDVWINFSYKGDDNPTHAHPGNISGVIYVENDSQPTIFPEHNIQYDGKIGTMILFPSKIMHYVEKKYTDQERITIAFNINKFD